MGDLGRTRVARKTQARESGGEAVANGGAGTSRGEFGGWGGSRSVGALEPVRGNGGIGSGGSLQHDAARGGDSPSQQAGLADWTSWTHDAIVRPIFKRLFGGTHEAIPAAVLHVVERRDPRHAVLLLALRTIRRRRRIRQPLLPAR